MASVEYNRIVGLICFMIRPSFITYMNVGASVEEAVGSAFAVATGSDGSACVAEVGVPRMTWYVY